MYHHWPHQNSKFNNKTCEKILTKECVFHEHPSSILWRWTESLRFSRCSLSFLSINRLYISIYLNKYIQFLYHVFTFVNIYHFDIILIYISYLSHKKYLFLPLVIPTRFAFFFDSLTSRVVEQRPMVQWHHFHAGNAPNLEEIRRRGKGGGKSPVFCKNLYTYSTYLQILSFKNPKP